MHERSICVFALTVFALMGSAAWAGDLDPPGAPASTPGPEPRIAVNQENTPGDSDAFFRIAQPGSYYLTGNIANHLVSSNRDGIAIDASNVTLDLNGFTLDGFEVIILPLVTPQGSPGSSIGIIATSNSQNIVIRNGIVQNWGTSGIATHLVDGGVIEDVVVRNNGHSGIACGENYVVRNCISDENGLDGINTQSRCQVIACVANANGRTGIEASAGSLVRDCTAYGNTVDGIIMFNAGLCHDNFCESNGGAGISLRGAGHRVEGNLMRSNDIGLTVTGSSSFIVGNAADNNSTMAYDVPGGNFSGTVVSNSANMSSANAWANFAF